MSHSFGGQKANVKIIKAILPPEALVENHYLLFQLLWSPAFFCLRLHHSDLCIHLHIASSSSIGLCLISCCLSKNIL